MHERKKRSNRGKKGRETSSEGKFHLFYYSTSTYQSSFLQMIVVFMINQQGKFSLLKLVEHQI